jgi:hypothetical protein
MEVCTPEPMVVVVINAEMTIGHGSKCWDIYSWEIVGTI